ncbi:protein CLT1, chloroplastic [Cucurbita pepo subsp. pepo]|uniref:protein CLT1, chloroplastic n=1 Tax=Cucurbita pepo subsp. pepo TaxID=3664 RepID=UPI000C9D8F83|nr:protein CLT1, chloroplastic [Cucurbita pepo subsp. pepo]
MTSWTRRFSAGADSFGVSFRLRQQPRSLAEVSHLSIYRYAGLRSGCGCVVLRAPKHRRLQAAEPSAAWDRSESGEEDRVKPCSYAVGGQRVEDLAEGNSGEILEKIRAEKLRRSNRKVEIVIAAVLTVIFGVANRVLYKLALIPLKHYPFFLAQLATFGYVIVYFSILYMRYHAGIVTDEMLSMPKAPYLVAGLLEALGAATGMAATAILSGASTPILSQTFLVWQILLSIIFLGRRYKTNQLFGCFLVSIGVVITVASGSNAGNSLKDAGIFWSILMIISFLFQAADTVLKEIIFLNASRQLKGRTMDLFVVNSFGSAFQSIFVVALLPFLSKLWGIPFSQLPSYLRDGTACFLNYGTLSGCDGAPLLPLLFILVNIGFNISLLHLLKISSAVVSSLASTFSVPIAVYMFTLPLPYIGVASSLPKGFVAGAVILVLGLLIYAWTPSGSSNPNNASSHAPIT